MVTLTNDKGRICVTNEVFTNLAGNAATSCFGVKGMVGRAKDSGPLQLLCALLEKTPAEAVSCSLSSSSSSALTFTLSS